MVRPHYNEIRPARHREFDLMNHHELMNSQSPRMPGISKELLKTQEARLWKEEGEAEFCRRVQKLEKVLLGKGELKRLPALLGIKRGSLYSILNGNCSYNLFFRQIGPAALSRLERSRDRRPTEDDQVLSELDWKALDLLGLVSKFAPSLLKSDKDVVTKNEVYPVAQKLVEDVIPVLAIAMTPLTEAIASAKKNPKRTNALLQTAIDGLPFPAGFSATETRPEILGCNKPLLELLSVEPAQVVGQTLNDLFGMILQRVPGNQQASTIELLQQRVGSRRISDTERAPFCFQFYFDKRGTTGTYNKAYLVTTLAFDLSLLQLNSIAVFIYQVREVTELP